MHDTLYIWIYMEGKKKTKNISLVIIIKKFKKKSSKTLMLHTEQLILIIY